MTLVICNIGNRDVAIKREVLPENMQDAISPLEGKRPTIPERERGQWLLDHPELHKHIEIPIIRPILNSIPISKIQGVILIASNQNNPEYRKTDTILTAEVAKIIIAQQYQLNISQIQIITLQDINPAEHDAVLSALEEKLPTIVHEFPQGDVYLEVTGGTPAMANGLLLAGTEIFRERAIAKYVSRSEPLPHTLNVGKRILSGPLRESFLTLVKTYQYQAARSMWSLYERYFDSRDEIALINTLLAHGAARLSLDLVNAKEILYNQDQLSRGKYRRVINELFAPLSEFQSNQPLSLKAREHILNELLHLAAIRLETGNYSEFLTLVVRFWENALRLQCLRFNIPFVTHNRKKLDDDGPYIATEWAEANAISMIHKDTGNELAAGQNYLKELLKRFNNQHPQVIELLNTAKKLESIITLRNKSTHRVQSVTAQELDSAFGGLHTDILPALHQLYAQLMNSTMGINNPYTVINTAIINLIQTH